MKNLKKEKSGSWKQGILFPCCIFVIVLVAGVLGGLYFAHMSNMQNIDLLRQSVRKAVVQCYAIEGAYPPNVEYIEKNYGIKYNQEKYFIDYEIFASNVMPNIEVYEKK